AAPAQAALKLGPYGPPEDEIGSWISISEDGTATLYSGCCELGTGSSPGPPQAMAEGRDRSFYHATLMGTATNRTVDPCVSSGSRVISAHSRRIRQAAAEARAALVHRAAERLNLPAEQLITNDGGVSMKGAPEKKVSYGELIGGRTFNL